MKQKVYAGVAYDVENYPHPTAAGRYCEWKHKTIDKSAESETFAQFMETLRLDCDDGEPAYLNWTVPNDAPDTLYYQCYTHNNLGWKIHVADPGAVDTKVSGVDSTSSFHILAIIVIALSTCLSPKYIRGRIF